MKAIKASLRVLEALVQKAVGVQAFPEFLAYRILILLYERDYERMYTFPVAPLYLSDTRQECTL